MVRQTQSRKSVRLRRPLETRYQIGAAIQFMRLERALDVNAFITTVIAVGSEMVTLPPFSVHTTETSRFLTFTDHVTCINKSK